MYAAVLMAAAFALLVSSVPVHASTMDDRIESSARKSYVFKTYLEGDDINIQSKEGVVSLTGTVSEESHKSLAQETVASLPGVKSVDNRLEEKVVDLGPIQVSADKTRTLPLPPIVGAIALVGRHRFAGHGKQEGLTRNKNVSTTRRLL